MHSAAQGHIDILDGEPVFSGVAAFARRAVVVFLNIRLPVALEVNLLPAGHYYHFTDSLQLYTCKKRSVGCMMLLHGSYTFFMHCYSIVPTVRKFDPGTSRWPLFDILYF